MIINMLVVLFFMFQAMDVCAEVILLKNGKSFEGKVLSRDAKQVNVDIGGISITYWADEVKSIAASAQPEQPVSPQTTSVRDKSDKRKLSAIELTGRERRLLWSSIRGAGDVSSAEDVLIKYKTSIMEFKGAFTRSVKTGNSGMNFDLMGWKDYSLLLIAETELARVRGDKKRLRENLETICVYISELNSHWKSLQRSQHQDLLYLTGTREKFLAFSDLMQKIFSDKRYEDVSLLNEVLANLKELDIELDVYLNKDVEIQRLKRLRQSIEEEIAGGRPLKEVMMAFSSERAAVMWGEEMVSDAVWDKVDALLSEREEYFFPSTFTGNRSWRTFLLELDERIDKFDSELRSSEAIRSDDALAIKIADACLLFELIRFRRGSMAAMHAYAQLFVMYYGLQVKRYQLDNGHLPDTWNDLQPKYIGGAPDDLFGDSQLQLLRPQPNVRLVCSIGPDNIDDNGKVLLSRDGLLQGKKEGDVCFTVE